VERAERARLEHEVIEISGREQKRIGQDLHDGLGQELTAIEILCAGLKSDVSDEPALAAQVDQIGRLLRESISHVRSLARGLVPVGEDPDSLWSSLVELADRTSRFARIDCRLESAKIVLCHSPAIAIQLHRIAQEAVNNAVKHSGGSRITLSLEQREGGLILTVRDDGRGGAVRRKDSLGLQVMHHRAAVINATLTVASTTGEGTVIRCFAPLPS
jgi:signal transduction histidine kinase